MILGSTSSPEKDTQEDKNRSKRLLSKRLPLNRLLSKRLLSKRLPLNRLLSKRLLSKRLPLNRLPLNQTPRLLRHNI